MTRIESHDDPRLTPYLSLTDSQLRSPGTDAIPVARDGLFVGEGALVVRRLLEWKTPLHSIALADGRLAAMHDVIERAPCPVYAVAQGILDRVAGYPVHRGVLSLAHRPTPKSPDDVACDAKRLVVVEALTDQENVGGIFRSAAALGFDGIVMSPDSCDPLSRRCVRVSVGHTVTMSWARATTWPQSLGALRADGWRILALTPSGDVEIEGVAIADDERVAVMVGAEGPGLSDPALAAASDSVRIAMAKGADSLNVAAATAIALHRFAPRRG